MNRSDWNETAKGFARYVGQFRLLVERGAVPLEFKDATEFEQEELPLVVGLFGNDNELGTPASREVELIRNRLHDSALLELGFGVSEDGGTWALLIEADNDSLQTAVAKTFRKELLKGFLEDIVWRAWQKANESS